MFLQNKYSKYYFNITSNAQTRSKPEGYVEKHHIIPKSFGGTNAKSNIAILTAREHFIVHRLLLKMTVGLDKRKMAMALSMFLTGCRNHTGRYQVSSREYELIRKELKTFIACQLIDPFDVIYSTDNLEQFCEEHNLKFNYMRMRYGAKSDQRMVVGPNKGWGIYFGIVQPVRNHIEICKESASKGWSPNRKPHKVKSTAMLVSLQHPNGEVFCDIPLKRFCKEHNLPPSQVQSAPSGTHLVGKWAGWIKL
jgi:hypothetical protein